MPSREYEKPLAPGVMLRVRLTWTHGYVDRFTVQLEQYDHRDEATGEGIWLPVVRYDSAHGEAHIDHLGPDGSKIRKDPLNIRWPYNLALDLAIHELSRNYPAHIARFQKMQEESR